MTIPLRQSTASQEIPLGYFLDSTDGNTEETGLTIANTDIKLWKCGATTLANKNSGGATHISDGVYFCVLDATDSDTLGAMDVYVHVTGALAIKVECRVMPAHIYDSLVLGTDKIEVDLIQMNGVAQSALDLKDFADAGYDPATNKVQGVVLCDTTTTNSDMRGTDSAATAAALTTHDGKLDTVDTNVDAILVDTGSTLDGKINTIDTNVDSILVDTGTTLENHLTDVKGGTFSGATDSLEAIRNRGDAAWITGGGGSISDILNVQALIPNSIDLANTATVRLALGLTNMLDDLPSTAEITPGTITIDRKAVGGTSWTNVVNAAACSEAAGLIYYDEVFDATTGYAAADSIRITFKSQKITVAANDYDITGTDGWMFQTYIRTTAGSCPSAVAIRQEMDSNSAQLAAILLDTGTTLDGKITTIDSTVDAILVDTGTTLDGKINTIDGIVDSILADTNELQTDWVNGGRLDLILDIIAADTTTDIPALIAALNDLSSANVTTACTTSLTTYDPPTRAEATTDKDAIITEVNANEAKIDIIDTNVDSVLADTGTDGVVVASGSKTGYALSAAGIDSILDEVVEGTLTHRQVLRILLAALAGKSSGGGTVTLAFRDDADSKSRITATVDVNGNRTAILKDGT